MEKSGGRAFGSESIASAKALRQEKSWHVLGRTLVCKQSKPGRVVGDEVRKAGSGR